MKLHFKIMIFMTIIVITVVGAIGYFTFQQVENTVETQMGYNAMDLGNTIASMEEIQKVLGTTKDDRVIQGIIEKFRQKTRFQYIIVMDMEGIKYSYPYENALGKKYRSGGEERVLTKGEAYVSADRNVLISAIRAFVPIYYEGEQVGAVLVGILTDTVYKEIKQYLFNLELILFFGLVIGIVGAWLLSYRIKRTIFGLEPKEIALLLGEREVVLHSLKYGIVAMNHEGNILFYNRAARRVLGLRRKDVGKHINIYHSPFTDKMLHVLKSKESIYNEEIKVSSRVTLLCSITLLRDHNDEVIGVVASFQDLTEVKEMAEELTGIKKMHNALRAQSHEFMNKLHTISGLIQLEEYDKAVSYISDISEQRQEIIGTLNHKINNMHIAGLLLAKYNKAAECKIALEIDPDSLITNMPETITVDEICSVIGNLIENAIDALVSYGGGRILIGLNSDEDLFRIWIEDNGPGIDTSIRERVFERGVTTKQGSRGIGLNIVKKIINQSGGTIKLLQDQGTIWDIGIPMERSSQDA